MVGVSKKEYWSLTPAETIAKAEGWKIKEDLRSNNFRSLFTLGYNQYAKHPKTQEQLWPLSIDKNLTKKMDIEDIYDRNRKIIEQMGSN